MGSMNEAMNLFAGAVFGGAAVFCVQQHLEKRERARRERALRDAERVLERHRMTTGMYLATLGQTNDELRNALHVHEHARRIVVDHEGRIVGGITAVPNTGPLLRLVVVNDEPST
jgi:predicted small secreted protein